MGFYVVPTNDVYILLYIELTSTIIVYKFSILFKKFQMTVGPYIHLSNMPISTSA